MQDKYIYFLNGLHTILFLKQSISVQYNCFKLNKITFTSCVIVASLNYYGSFDNW